MARDMKAGARRRGRGRPSQAPAPPVPQAVAEQLGSAAFIGPHLQLHLLSRGI